MERVWEAETGSDMLDDLISKHVADALKEYLEDAPWMFEFPWVTFFAADPAEITSKKIELAELVLDYIENQCNEYFGTGEQEAIEAVHNYLVKLTTRVAAILEKIKEGNARNTRLSEQDTQKFEKMFEFSDQRSGAG